MLSLITATHYRLDKLKRICLPSVLKQTDQAFEWVVVNDGADIAICEFMTQFMAQVKANGCSITYLEMTHPSEGFGLCHARNLGLSAASGELVAYLDDDNAIAPEFVARTKQFFQSNSSVKCSMVQQHRRRDVVKHGQVVRQGKPFISPGDGSTIEAFLQQQALFDSNGFTHVRQGAPQWNPQFKVFIDYEYLLRLMKQWGRESFKLNQQVLVDYVQSSEGVIGQSSYQDWAEELQKILESGAYPLTVEDIEVLARILAQWQDKALANSEIPAFAAKC